MTQYKKFKADIARFHTPDVRRIVQAWSVQETGNLSPVAFSEFTGLLPALFLHGGNWTSNWARPLYSGAG